MTRTAIFLISVVFAAAAAGAGAYQFGFLNLEPIQAAFKAKNSKPAGANEKAGAKASGGGSVTVEVSEARGSSSTKDIRAVGSLRSDESVQIASEISGRVAEIFFKEGKPVAKGDQLVTLDDALAKAEVADAEARFELAKSNLGRARALSKTGNVTEKAQDEAASNFGTASAAVELAKTRLSKHIISAPFSGMIGSRLVSAGAYLTAGAAIVNLEKIDTLKVTFKLPEIHLAEIKTSQKIELTVDALPGEVFHGEIYAIDPQVDVNGRALQIRAFLPNRDMKLRPGLFARITVKGMKEQKVVIVPESAIVPKGGQSFVYRVNNGKVSETKVKLGSRSNAEVEIVAGLDPGAQVVTAGQQNLRDGQDVVITQASRQPAANAQQTKQGS